MKQSDIVWGLFAITGNIDAYLLYLDCIRRERTQDTKTNGGVLELS